MLIVRETCEAPKQHYERLTNRLFHLSLTKENSIAESDTLDSWDVEEEPVSTPEDDVSAKLQIKIKDRKKTHSIRLCYKYSEL